MASPEHRQAHRPASSVDIIDANNHDHELLQSLNKLSLAAASRSGSNSPSTLERRRSFINSSPRVTPRSPLTRANLNGLHEPQSTSPPGLIRKSSMSSLHSANGRPTSRPASRRGSSNSYLSPTGVKIPTSTLPPIYGEATDEKLARRIALIANANLAKELELLHATALDRPTETVVILNDDCYGHRYSRPRSSKSVLNTIVERPERIQASILGVSMAYVRLGERHCEGKYPVQETLDPKGLPSIPFRIHKTDRKVPLSSTAVTNVHGTKWMEELKIMCDSAEEKLALNGNELARPDMNRGSDAAPLAKFHQGDLYLCPESLNALEAALGAVCEAVDLVFSTMPHRRAFVAVRPPGHHCSATFPSGFCWVNNVHVGIMHGILNHGLTHAAIIDFDLHHGDGSQAIAWQHNKRGLAKNAASWKKTSIGYFSVHDINSYPCENGEEEKVKNASLCIENAHGQNIWNVHLQEWKSNAEFWKLYESKYSILLEKARNYLQLQTERFRAAGQVPKAAIFISAGFDASEWEGAGMQRHKVNVPTEFYARLTRDVVRVASEEGLGVDGRVISVLEGGYSDRALYSGVFSHLSGLAPSSSVAPKDEGAPGLGQEMGNKARSANGQSTSKKSNPASLKDSAYNPNWWCAAELDLFDAARVDLPPEPKKPRNFMTGNYSSPTHASNAKMADSAKIRRSLSNLSTTQIISRSPTPTSPDVPWTAAAYELSKLLIPKNRQVDSCTHSDLNTEATKIKKERQVSQTIANAGDVSAAPTRMSLRERKPVSYAEDDCDDLQLRRKPVSGSAALSTSKVSARTVSSQGGPGQTRQTSRGSSMATTLSSVSDAQSSGTASTRPVSSTSTRPFSSMSISSQTTSGTVDVKKTRQPAATKKQPMRAPSSSRAQNVMTSPPANTASRGVDQLTNEMKKIKITVLTKEQKEARLRAQLEMAGAGNIPAPTQDNPVNNQLLPPLVVTETRPYSVQSNMGILKDVSPPGEFDTPYEGYQPTGPKVDTLIHKAPTIITPTESSPPSSSFASSPSIQLTPEQAHDTHIFIPYEPNGSQPDSIPIQGSIQILEPNSGTPGLSSHTKLPQSPPY